MFNKFWNFLVVFASGFSLCNLILLFNKIEPPVSIVVILVILISLELISWPLYGIYWVFKSNKLKENKDEEKSNL